MNNQKENKIMTNGFQMELLWAKVSCHSFEGVSQLEGFGPILMVMSQLHGICHISDNFCHSIDSQSHFVMVCHIFKGFVTF